MRFLWHHRFSAMANAAKLANKTANYVLKYLRWRRTDADGNVAVASVGEVFDLGRCAVPHGIQILAQIAR